MNLYRLEVGPKAELEDPIGDKLAREFRAHGYPVKGVRRAEVYLVQSSLIKDLAQAEELTAKLFIDPVLHQDLGAQAYGDYFQDWDYLVEVSYKPGVTDNAAHVAKENLELLLNEAPQVASAKAYFIAGALSLSEVERAADQLLLNGLIEKKIVIPKSLWLEQKPQLLYFPQTNGDQKVETERMDCSTAQKVWELSEARLLALSKDEAQVLAEYFARPDVRATREKLGIGALVTDVELECLAQTWSEHCKHKIFSSIVQYQDDQGQEWLIKSLYKTYIQASTLLIKERLGKNDWCLSVFKDNAGVIKFDENWSVAFKVETHNSPSALDPYGGALTGIVGVNRDAFGTGMGAKLIANTDVFCFGPLDYNRPLPKKLFHPTRIFEGVRLGVEHGGNQSGVPTINGAICFDEGYIGKPLVFCGTLSIMPAKHQGEPSEYKKARPGDHILMCGGRIGKDGIHGATFSSLALEEVSPVSAVQIGDPITQKRMWDFLWVAKEENLYSCITDNGAGGLSSSVGEMAQDSGGAKLHLDRAPLKYPGLQPWEIFVSEAQERMTLAVPPQKVARFLALSNEMRVESSDLGEFTDSGFLECFYQGEIVAALEMEFMHGGLPPMRIKAQWETPDETEPDYLEDSDLGPILKKILARPNICSKERVIRQYDHEVGGGSVIKPLVGPNNDGPGDAGVLRPVLGSERGLVVSNGICPKYSAIDTYHMAACAIDEAIRNSIASGGSLKQMAGLDNFCWPDPVLSEKTPDGPYKMAQLVRACQAIYDYTLAFGVPCISGKDSMKNDANLDGKKISILPTLLFSAVAVIDQVGQSVTSDFKAEGDLIYLLGATKPEMGASEYYSQLGLTGGAVPKVDAALARIRYDKTAQAVAQGWLSSIHDCSDGGLAVALAESAFGGGLGALISLSGLLEQGLSPAQALFSESASRFVVSLNPANRQTVQALFGSDAQYLGQVTLADRLLIQTEGLTHLDQGLSDLKASWQSYLKAHLS
ncbi:MAG: phosphoribosylformylglycinamidine synthase [Candidatus Lambdaproteobacteria bacterium RIFOXYD2_FULL_50_16]|uniref:Phosphoribosylformylglycinamidine synthase subunit PurL n=1 Tax=Candidatus Lambdaproteobacteria bacterium RIFOXYD2_FULL_50_16 TaxID=1817772 RepID=A0A1F6GF73_9PROT|nr:MAG: phosphoribosylformylglycinamidine synthase [Candidatus Lambdaproteobacteria bacterium RIFOXYD2_FULL_50_16]